MTAMKAAYVQAVEADMEAHHERLHAMDLAKQARLGAEVIYHEVGGKIIPLRIAEPGEMAAIEAASGLS